MIYAYPKARMALPTTPLPLLCTPLSSGWPCLKQRRALCSACGPEQTPLEGTPSTSFDYSCEVLLQEKVDNKTIRRYIVDKNHRLKIVETEKLPKWIHIPGDTEKDDRKLFSCYPLVPFPSLIRDFFLPADFPDAVSDDYLQYMLWQLPTNCTGWISSTLVTSSLLKAVGLSTSAESTLAATAAIKWVSKDGLGALGRLLIGGRFGRIFDDDPKQWRMYADVIGSLGSIFELATPFMPDSFLLLASLGNLTKAVAKGLKDPSFRVIQNHFALSDNLGEIAAKEEVWEVTAQLVGLSVGVLLLATPGLVTPYSKLLLTWVFCRSLHLWLRYHSLTAIQFPTMNYKRTFILVEAHVSGSPIPGYKECNQLESLFVPWQISRQHIHLGCSLKDVFGSNASIFQVETLLRVYANEKHLLKLDVDSRGSPIVQIIFKEEATSMTVLRSIWQAQWILSCGLCDAEFTGLQQGHQKPIKLEAQMTVLTRSLEELNKQFSVFLDELVSAGWELQTLLLRVPKEAPFLTDSVSYSTADSLDDKYM